MTRFYRDVFERFHRIGALRFSELRLDGSLIAISLDVLHGRRLYAFKISYDERYSAFAPGNVLRLATIERCCGDDAMDAQELMGPMRRWKERFASDTRDTAVVRAYRRRPAPLARYAGRLWVVPWLRPIYVKLRRALDRLRERRPG
jgi:hypothetical protein